MEEITMIYLENNDADYCKSRKKTTNLTQILQNSSAFFYSISRYLFGSDSKTYHQSIWLLKIHFVFD